jgi:hypothetical protein
VHLLAQAPLRADVQAAANQEHADHQLGIDRGPSCCAVEASQMLTQFRAVDKAVNGPQNETLAHHGLILRRECLIRESRSAAIHEEFFNKICHERTFASHGQEQGHRSWKQPAKLVWLRGSRHRFWLCV